MNRTLRNFIFLALWLVLPNLFFLTNIDPLSEPPYYYIFWALIFWLPVFVLFFVVKRFVLMGREEKKELFKKETEKLKFDCKKSIKDLKDSIIGLIALTGMIIEMLQEMGYEL